MDFQTLCTYVRSASFELDNTKPCNTEVPYDIYLNGKNIAGNRKRNIFSLYGLKPGTTYELTVKEGDETVIKNFSTKNESFRLDVSKFGAAGDGKKNDTSALQAAIACCPRHGTVLIPSGTYLTGPLFLKSDMTLQLERGACLLGITERSKYPILPGATVSENGNNEYYLGMWEGNPLSSFASLLNGIHVRNVDITGEGILDGNAEKGDWWKNPKVKSGAWRPRILFLNRCENIRIQGVTFRNSYSWTIHPFLSRRVSLIDIRVRNDPDSPNTDGMDIESCRDVDILGADISVGDDCIVLKSCKRYLGKRLKTPTSGITIRNCLLQRGHGAVVIGSEVSAGVCNVLASQCIFAGTDRGLRIKTRRGRGKLSVVDGIRMKNIIMDYVATPFVVNMFYYCDPDGHSEFVWTKKKLPLSDITPKVGSIKCENIKCNHTSIAGMFFYGLPEMPIENIDMRNIIIKFSEKAKPGFPDMMDKVSPVKKVGIYANNVACLNIKNVSLIGYSGEKITAINVDKLNEEE